MIVFNNKKSKMIKVKSKYKKTKKQMVLFIAKLTGKAAASFVFLALLINSFLTLVIPSHSLSLFGSKFYSIVSDSMEPQIKTGSLIAAKEAPLAGEIGQNEIIIYKAVTTTGSVIIAHRVLEVVITDGKTEYITKGDNAKGIDSYLVAHEDILGIYKGKSIPLFGYLFSFISSFYGFICLVLILILIILAIVINTFMEKFDRDYLAKKNILGKSHEIIDKMLVKYGDQPEIVFLDYAFKLLNEEPYKDARGKYSHDLEELANQKNLQLPEGAKVHEVSASEITIIRPKKK